MIRHIMIMQSSGIPLFTSSYERGLECCSEEHLYLTSINEKSPLFSSLLSSIRSLATEFGGHLSQMRLGPWDIFLQSLGDDNKEIIGVLLSTPVDESVSKDQIQDKLIAILNLFTSNYKKELETWKGEISQFHDFNEIIKKKNLVPIDAIQKELCITCIENLQSNQ